MSNELVVSYEMMMILRPNLGESKTQESLNEVKASLNEAGGEILNEDLWGTRDLSYKIKGEAQGYYVVLNFTMEPEAVKALEKTLVLNQDVIRFLIVKTTKNYVFKTYAEYKEEAEKEASIKEEAQTKEKEEQEKRNSRSRRPVAKMEQEKPVRATKKVEEKEEEEAPKKHVVKAKVEKAPKEEEAEVEEVKEEKEEKKSAPREKLSLDDVDKKLKSIIDDPDITL